MTSFVLVFAIMALVLYFSRVIQLSWRRSPGLTYEMRYRKAGATLAQIVVEQHSAMLSATMQVKALYALGETDSPRVSALIAYLDRCDRLIKDAGTAWHALLEIGRAVWNEGKIDTPYHFYLSPENYKGPLPRGPISAASLQGVPALVVYALVQGGFDVNISPVSCTNRVTVKFWQETKEERQLCV